MSVYLGVHGDLIQKGNGGLRKLRDHPPPIGSELYVEDFLYDNDTDPNQLVNLVCKPELVDIRKMLGTMYSNEMERIGEIRPKIVRCCYTARLE